MHTASVVLRHSVSILAGLIVAVSPALAQTPLAGPNINMVSGTTWPAGDPFLTKQNEPSIAVSSRNPMHLLGGANDYRLTNVDVVPITGETDAGDAWVTVFKSTDGGATWRASLIKGCPQPIPECGSASGPNPNPVKASNAEYAADPTISSGPYGTYFYSFIAGRRDSPAGGVTAIQRFVDLNNEVKSGDDPFVEDPPVPSIIDTGTQGQFLDKSWNKADVPGRPWNGTTTCLIQGYSQPVPAFNVYISYSNFVGQADTNPHPQILVARSTDCGVSYSKAVKVSQSIQTNQGSTMVIDPPTGTLYVLWRAVADPTNGTLDGIYMNTSSDGGNSWGNATLVSNILPFDQGDATGVSFRTRSFPSATISVDSTGKSRLHVAWSQRKAPLSTCLDANGNVIFDITKNCDARIRLGTYDIAAGTWAFSWVDDWNVDPNNPANPGRGHQFMPALNSVNGKIAAVWYDQRFDATIGRMVCTVSPCTSMLNFDEIRVKTENFVAGHPEFVFTPFLADAPVVFKVALGADGNPILDSKNNPVMVPNASLGLARRHTVDTFGALADAANMPVFTSSRISQYLLGNLKGTPANPDPTCGPKGVCAEAQQQNPVNVPIAAGGTRAFIGDYLEVAAQAIVPTGNANVPYGFNCGKTISNAKGPVCFNAAGDALQPVKSQPVFHAAWTDNRDVVRPWDGDWTHQTPIHVIVTSADGSTASVSDNLSCAPGQDGSRNSNVYTAAFSGGSRGLINANTKKLDAAKLRGFVVGVQNLVAPNLPADTGYRAYRFTILPTSATASFDRFAPAPPPPALTTVTTLYVPPQSSSWRTVWALSSTPAAAITVDISLIVDPVTGQPITIPVKVSDLGQYAFQPVSQLGLNADPLATLNLNADSNTTDLATNTLNNSTLNNSTLSNNTLNNSTLNNLTLSNLTLSNITLSNSTLNNVDPETITLNNNTLNNNTLNNLTLSNATLNNATLNNSTLSNATLNNLTLSNVTLSNADLTNLALNNLTLNNSTLSNTEIADTALTNNAVTSDALTNSYPADTTYTVANAGNTDTTIDIKTLLRGQKVPDGYTMQLVLRKVVLVPNAVGRCYIGLLQQNAQVASLSTPTAAVDDATLGQFINDATAATLPLSAGEKAQLTMRVARKDDPDGVQAAEVGRYGDRFVAIGQAGTTTSIPLIIKTLSLPSVIVHKTASLPVISFGGNGSTINWTLQAPPWITLSASTGTTVSLIVNKPPDVGTFLITLKITDSSAPPGPDLFCRYKPDPQGPFVGAIGCDSENFQLVVTK